MAMYRKLGKTSSGRKALLKNQVTNLLYRGKIETTEARAKEVKKIAEKFMTLAIKEKDNFEEVTVTSKVAKKDANGKRVKEVVNGKKVTVFEEVQKTVRKDSASRLAARRKMLAYMIPVVEVADVNKKNKTTTKVDMPEKVFELAKKYEGRKGGYTRIIKCGPRKGDCAEVVILEFVD